MNRDVEEFHKVAYFFAALAHGAENNLGKGTKSLCTLAGKKFGKDAVEHSETTADPVRALEILLESLKKIGVMWEVEPFPGKSGEPVSQEGSEKKMRLVFRTCMVRNALFRYAHQQEQSLCYMAHGVFAGGMEKIMPGTTMTLEILRACPNACLKELVWREK